MYFDFYRFRWVFVAVAVLVITIPILVLLGVTKPHHHGASANYISSPVGAVLAPVTTPPTPDELTALRAATAAVSLTQYSPSALFTHAFTQALPVTTHLTLATTLGKYPNFSNIIKVQSASQSFCLQLLADPSAQMPGPVDVVACP